MPNSIDLSTDWLADAPLSADQRRVWDLARAELIAARDQIQGLETRLRAAERLSAEDGAQHTVLTRPEFNREVARMLAFDERYGGTSSVLYFDIENMADIITRYGRSVGNAAVRVICDTMMKHIRNSDIVGRLAGDEFGVLLARCDNTAAWKKGELLATRLQETMAEVHGCALQPVISYGAYTFRTKDDVGNGLKQAAELVTRAQAGL